MLTNLELIVTPPEILRSHVEYCLPKELIPSDWKCTDRDPLKNLENLLRLSNGKLDHYGSNIVTLFEYLKSYASFPGSWSFFKNPKTAIYTNHVLLYTSLGKGSFVYKRDMYAMLQSLITKFPLKQVEAEIAISMVVYFLKIQERKVNASEMTETSQTMFAQVQWEIDGINNLFTSDQWKANSPLKVYFDRMSFEEASSVFVNVLHCFQNEDDDGKDVVEMLKKYSEKHPMKQNGPSYHKILTWVGLMIMNFRAFILAHPALMKPSEQVLEPKPDSKIIVRLFHLSDQKLVLVHELYQRMKMGGFDVSGLEDVVQGMPDVGTITFRQVFELVPKDLMKNIEFVCIKEHYLIPLVDGGYCLMEDGKLVKYSEDAKGKVANVIDSNEQSVKRTDEEVLEPVVEEEKEEQKPKKKKTKTQKKKIISSEDADDAYRRTDHNEHSSTTNSDEEVVEEKKMEMTMGKKTKTQKKKKTILKDPVMVKKESESCQKCFRASSFTRMANEKLKSEKIATKQLRKRLAELEMENLEKDEKIRALTTTVETLRTELEDKEEVIRRQKEQVQEVHKQLDCNIETIEDLESAISLAPVPEVTSEEGTPTRASEASEKVRDALLNLLNIQATLQKEAPIQTVRTMTHKLTVKSSCAEVQKRLRFETIMYRQACHKYIEAVELNLSMIRANQQITADQIPELPPFPTLSQWFQDVYTTTMKTDAPIICESLIKSPESDPNELVDKECLICLEHMDSAEETIKCECCKRRYHGDCIKEWFNTKRMCPTCNSGMLNDDDFPTL